MPSRSRLERVVDYFDATYHVGMSADPPRRRVGTADAVVDEKSGRGGVPPLLDEILRV